jgi:HAMP domain-containing protein
MTDRRAPEGESARSYAETWHGRRFHLTLGRQIALACMSLALLAVALVSTVDATRSSRHLRDKLEARAALYADQLRRQMAPVVAFDDAATAREIFDSMAIDTDVAGIAAYKASGEVIEGVGRYPDHLSAGATPDTFDQDLFVATAGIATKEGITGQLYVSLSKARIRKTQIETMWTAAGTAAVALLIALALAIPIARHLTRRLSRIIDAATSIAHGDFDQPAIEDGVRDEIGMLAGAGEQNEVRTAPHLQGTGRTQRRPASSRAGGECETRVHGRRAHVQPRREPR